MATKATTRAARRHKKRRQQWRKWALIAVPVILALSVLLVVFWPGRGDVSTPPAPDPGAEQTESAENPADAQPEAEASGEGILGDESLEPGAQEADPSLWDDAEDDEAATEPQPASPDGAPQGRGYSELGEIVNGSSIKRKQLRFRQQAFRSGKLDKSYQRAEPIHMGPGESYAQLPGVTTFRGNNYRDSAAYGLVPEDAQTLQIKWSVSVGGMDEWNGVGWTGQAAIVQWPDDVRSQMNIKAAKRDKQDLKEVIIAALDGKIRFLDLDDGKETRKPISLPAPIKGSVTVDPRGYPLLYCGQGLFEVGGRTVKCGTRIFNLLNQKTVFFLNGSDKFRLRNWYCFDAAPLVDGNTDTMLQLGENGLTYLVKLNTEYDREQGKIKIKPQVDRYGYKSNITTRPGMENSIAVYNHYGYFVDNSGLLICLDLNTLKAKWASPTGDDTDATCAIEEDEEGVWLYTANEIDLRGDSGNMQMRCYNALTGKVRWKVDVHVSNRSLAGSFASPAIGKGTLSQFVYFNIAKTGKGGTLFALDKKTGKAAWARGLNQYSWSTPALLYDKAGRGYVLIGNANGTLRLIDGLSGEIITKLELKNNIEGSPAVFDDMAVVSTRGGKIYGIQIS